MNLTRTTVLRHFQLFCPVSDAAKNSHHPAYNIAPKASMRKAAVLVGLVERPSGLNIIFTRRARHLKHHPGQICFPGGKHEPEDQTIFQTAIREAQEEIGLTTEDIEPIGQLPELNTVSLFSVTPVIAFVSPGYNMVIQRNEVEEVFEVPASFLFNPRHLHRCHFSYRQTHHRIVALNYQHYFIWGATARIIEQLQQHLFPQTYNSFSAKKPYRTGQYDLKSRCSVD